MAQGLNLGFNVNSQNLTRNIRTLNSIAKNMKICDRITNKQCIVFRFVFFWEPAFLVFCVAAVSVFENVFFYVFFQNRTFFLYLCC